MFATLDKRSAHKVGASMGSLKMLAFLGRKQRTSRKTTETLAFRVESVSDYGVPENACIFGGYHGVHRLAEPQGSTSPLDSTGKPIS